MAVEQAGPAAGPVLAAVWFVLYPALLIYQSLVLAAAAGQVGVALGQLVGELAVVALVVALIAGLLATAVVVVILLVLLLLLVGLLRAVAELVPASG